MHCYQNNTVIANGFIRRLASALPSMARAAGAPQDVQWLEIAQNMDPLPTVLDDAQIGRVYTLAGEYDGSTCKRPKPRQSIGNCGTRMAAPGQDECEACGSRPPGSQNVNTWHVFPGEVTSLASPAEERQIAINTLRNDAPWAQGNSFSSAFSQAARVGMPVHEWLPELHKMISSSMRNFVVYQGGGGVEVAGALQMVSDLMLQSITKADGSGDSYMALFPLDVVHTDLQFHRLRGKGGFVVSARWCKAKEQLDGAIELHSEAGERCKFLLPRPAGSVDVTVGSGATVHFTLTNQTWLSFDTVAGADYRIVVHARAQLLVATPQVPSPAKSAQAPKYTGGHTLWNVYTEHMAVPTRSRSLDIRQFGGRGDGVHDNTNAFSAAMHAARVTPGGAEVVVPSGVWLTAPFNLTSHLTLNVTHGATLLASEDPMAWPIIAPLPSYGQGRDHPGPRRTSFLHGVHVSDVVLCGGGTIDGQGSAWWKRRSNGSETVTRGRLFEVEWSDGILLQDLLFTNSPFWTLHPVYSTNIVARRLNVSNPLHSPNTDGFDPDSCENVTFVDSFYSGGDDAVAIKSGWDCFGTSYARPSRHISIRNLTVRSPHAAGICIGSEMSGGVEDVTVQDVVMHDVGEGLRIKASRTRGGYVRNVSYSNITITSFRERAIQVNDFYGVPNPSCAGVNATSPDPPRISGIRFIGVHARHNLGTKSAADFEGLDASPIASVWLEDVSLPGAGGDGAGGADGGGGASAWTCKRVAGHSINVQPRPCAELAACATAGQGRSLHSFFSTTEPTVDGRLEPYECAPTYADATTFTNLCGRHNTWMCEFAVLDDTSDLSIRGFVKHTADALYFAFNVTDNLVYGTDTKHWLPTGNPLANALNASGWPFFGDEIELLMNAAVDSASGRSSAPTDVAGNMSQWQLVYNLAKSTVHGVGTAGLLPGDRPPGDAYYTYLSWIERGLITGASSVHAMGYAVEWRVGFELLQLQPGRPYVSDMPDTPVGLNIAVGDADRPQDAFTAFGLRHEQWWSGEAANRTQVREFGVLWLMHKGRARLGL